MGKKEKNLKIPKTRTIITNLFDEKEFEIARTLIDMEKDGIYIKYDFKERSDGKIEYIFDYREARLIDLWEIKHPKQ